MCYSVLLQLPRRRRRRRGIVAAAMTDEPPTTPGLPRERVAYLLGLVIESYRDDRPMKRHTLRDVEKALRELLAIKDSGGDTDDPPPELSDEDFAELLQPDIDATTEPPIEDKDIPF
jgi:hypothetical protein